MSYLSSPFDGAGRDLCALTTYFDPVGFKTPRSHYHTVAAALERVRVPLFTVECAFADRPFALSGPSVLQLRATSRCWQKERLLNELERHVPPQYTKLAWIDADVLFENGNWATETSVALEKYPIVQLFDSYLWLGQDNKPMFDVAESGALAGFATKSGPQIITYDRHPGFAWAMRRSLWKKLGGLYDIAGTTAGDSVICCACKGLDTVFGFLACGKTAMGRARYAEWRKAVCGKASWIPGMVRHLWHGDRHDRLYEAFEAWLAQCRFNPQTDLRIADNGVWEFTGRNPVFEQRCSSYLRLRKEDGQQPTPGA